MVVDLRFYITYESETSLYYSTYAYFGAQQEGYIVSYSIGSLSRDTKYTIKIRTELLDSLCRSYVSGNFSEPVSLRTNATCK